MKDLSETDMKEKLLVGTKAYVLIESIDPYDVQTGKLVQLDKLTIIEVFVCDRLRTERPSLVTDRVFTTYKVAPTSREESNKLSFDLETAKEDQENWDKPFEYDGPIACTKQQLLEMIEGEFEAFEAFYVGLVNMTRAYLAHKKHVSKHNEIDSQQIG